MSDTLITEGQETNTADQQQADDASADTGDASEAAQQTDQSENKEAPAADSEHEAKGEQGDDKADQSDKSDKSDKTDESDKSDQAPDEYVFKAPDDQALNPAVVESFSQVAKDLNLSQDAAQHVIDAVVPAMRQQQIDQMAAVHETWASDAKADKEFGGDKLNENLAVAKQAIDTFGTPELTTLLNASGLGNHPEVIRAFYRAGKAISQDTFVGGKANPQGESTTAQRMYPGMNP